MPALVSGGFVPPHRRGIRLGGMATLWGVALDFAVRAFNFGRKAVACVPGEDDLGCIDGCSCMQETWKNSSSLPGTPVYITSPVGHMERYFFLIMWNCLLSLCAL